MKYIGKKEAKVEILERIEELSENTVLDCMHNMLNAVTF